MRTLPERTPRFPRGLGLAEVVVVVLVAAVALLVLLTVLPRQQAAARALLCRRQLHQIGGALVLYDQAQGRLPAVPSLEGPEGAAGGGPIAALLRELGVVDFTALDEPAKAAIPGPNPASAQPRRIVSLLCPDDRQALLSAFPAPISYRATAGDQIAGTSGAFAPGRSLSLAEIDASDGLAYTAAFSERLVGSGRPGVGSALARYARVRGPLDPEGCGALADASWHDDAGFDWSQADWRSSLYQHADPPQARVSCLADDGRTAHLGASSSHPDGVNVLRFDLSVRPVTSTVDRQVWKALARVAGASEPAHPDEAP